MPKRNPHTSLEDLGEENLTNIDGHRIEYAVKTLREADELQNDLAWRDSVWENLTVEELIGALLEAEEILERHRDMLSRE